jgi:hypothetical protein
VHQKLWNLVGMLFYVYASSGKNLNAIAWEVFKLCLCQFILGDTWMNFHNFYICPLIMKFCGECPGTLGLLGKIFFYCLIYFNMIS